MGTGQEFAKKLGIFGSIAVLALSIVATVMMFTSRGAAVEGYVPPESGEYYATRLDELLEEIETNLLPRLDAPGVELSLSEGKISVIGEKEPLRTAYLAIIHYFDPDLFEFTEVPE